MCIQFVWVYSGCGCHFSDGTLHVCQDPGSPLCQPIRAAMARDISDTLCPACEQALAALRAFVQPWLEGVELNLEDPNGIDPEPPVDTEDEDEESVSDASDDSDSDYVPPSSSSDDSDL